MPDTLTADSLIDELQRSLPLVEVLRDPLSSREERAQPRYETLADPIELDLVLADGGRVRALLADISPGGARILADRVPPCGQVVSLVFHVAGRRVDISGEVVHIGADDEAHYFGVQFADGRAWPLSACESVPGSSAVETSNA